MKVSIQDFCQDFYDSQIFHPVIAGQDMKWSYIDTAYDSIVKKDKLLNSVDRNVFRKEMMAVRMEMHPFRVPSLPVVVRQTWARTKPIILMVFPIYVAGGAIVQGLYASGWLDPINNAISFLTVGWPGAARHCRGAAALRANPKGAHRPGAGAYSGHRESWPFPDSGAAD